MVDAYTINIKGRVFGPVPTKELVDDIARGLLGPGATVWNDKHKRWFPVLQAPELYDAFFAHQELQLANLADPANSQRRVVLTNRQMLIYDGSSHLAAAVDKARRMLGTKLPEGSLALPLTEIERVAVKQNPGLPLVESLMVDVDYLDSSRQHRSLSFTIYPADKTSLIRALNKARPNLKVEDAGERERLERMAESGGSINVQNVRGDLVHEKIGMKVEDQRTQIKDSVINRSTIGEAEPTLDPPRAGSPQPAKLFPNGMAATPGSRECPRCKATLKGEWRRCPYCEI